MAKTIFGGDPNPGAAVGSLAGAASDIFAGFADKAKGAGDLLEQQNYQLAAVYAEKEAEYTKMSTAIQEFQQQREVTKSLGETQASVAGAGFAASGSAIDILRDSAAQGALQHAVLAAQGLVQEEGYKEQEQSYRNMAAAAGDAAAAENKAAGFADITAGIKVAAAIAQMPLMP
jgi:hypothetical protein